ncbi:MAG: hypothetical protein P4M00_09575 [Azospirillaceae bacterium]|nr:hypothetical protein [Azospirillaceae bacterium]
MNRITMIDYLLKYNRSVNALATDEQLRAATALTHNLIDKTPTGRDVAKYNHDEKGRFAVAADATDEQAGRSNIGFHSVDDAIAYWKQHYADQVRGATSARDFANRMQGILKGKRIAEWHRYNSVNPDWIPVLVNIINSMESHKQKWLQQRARPVPASRQRSRLG